MSTAQNTENIENESFEKAYNKVLPELEALGPDDLIHVNLEIVSASLTALGVLPELRALRPRIAKLPEFDLEKFDRLGDYAAAAAHAQTLHMVAVQPPDDLREVLEEGTKIRDLLFAESRLLILRGVINEDALRELKRGIGFRVLVTDLQLLINVFKANWPKIDGKFGTTREELERYTLLVFKLAKIIGHREQGPTGVAHTTLMRDRAYTLFVRTYEEARRAVGYLREDVDSIIPSLFRSRGVRKKVVREEDAASLTLPGLGPVMPPTHPLVSPLASKVAAAEGEAALSEGPFVV